MFLFDALLTLKPKVAEAENSGTAKSIWTVLTWALGSLPFPQWINYQANYSKTVLVTSSALWNLAHMSGLATIKPLSSFWFLEFQSVHISPYVSCNSLGRIVLLKPSLVESVVLLKNVLLSASLVNVVNDSASRSPHGWRVPARSRLLGGMKGKAVHDLLLESISPLLVVWRWHWCDFVHAVKIIWVK